MNITVERLPECKAKIQVEVTAEAVTEERSRILKAFKGQAKIPGFRPGKIPNNVIETRFGEQIKEELENTLVQQGTRKAVVDESLDVLLVTSVDDPKHNEDGTFSFTTELTLAPSFELPEIENIPVKLPELTVDDENIDRAIDGFRERMGEFKNVEGRELAMGDFATVSYKGDIDGEPAVDVVPKNAAYLGESESYMVKMDAEGFLPGFCEAIAGMSQDEKRDIQIRIPEEFPIPEIAGIEMNYSVELKEIKEQILPPVDEALAEMMFPGKSLEESRTMIREQIQLEQERHVEGLKSEQVVEYLRNNVEFDLPPEIVKEETQRRVDEIVERGQSQGMEQDDIVTHKEQIFSSATAQAESNVKARYLLLEVAKKQEFTATKNEILQQVAMAAQQHKTTPKKLLKQLEKANNLGQIRDNILVGKALDFLKSNASVEMVDPSEFESAES